MVYISIFIISIDALAFLLFLSIILFFYLSYNGLVRKKSIAYGKKINDESRSMISTITDSLTGFAEIRLKNIENFFLKKLIKSYPNIKGGRKNFSYHHQRILKTLRLLKKYFKNTQID